MIWGLSTEAFTLTHVIISLIGIVSGLIVLFEMMKGRRLNYLTGLFLLTTVLTSVTGFGFPFDKLLPAHKVGIISLVVLFFAILGLYVFRLRGFWRPVYVISAAISLHLNVFVLIVQGFRRVPALHSLAPTQSEPPFAVAQLVVLLIFIVLTVIAVRKYRPV